VWTALAALMGAENRPAVVISPADAAKHENERCTVEMAVKSTGGREKQNVFLNSETDFHNAKNFTVVIFAKVLEKFKDAGINDPQDFYKGKTIRVTGKITQYEKKFQIIVDDPKQVEVVAKK
jgi:DNA/RNA endonuclease YhcR with UshA esterase domain